MTFTINKENVPYDKITVHYCRNKEQCNENICKSIPKVLFTRYLGITFDENLRWNVHIDNIVMRLRMSMYKFYKLKDIFPINIVRNIYLSFYQAVFQYGIRVWGGLTQKAIKPLQLQQNKIIRICLN